MGLHEPSNRQYFKVSLGKIRKKVKEGTPGAVARTTEENEIVHELVYVGITGKLESISIKEHPEYGRSWTANLADGEDKFGIQISEESRYGSDFLKKIPNLKKNALYTFTPYDFESFGERKTGLSIKTESGEKIGSYYQKFTEKDGKIVVENLHAFPEFTGDKKDKDEWKMYFIKVTKFLREKALNYLANEFEMVSPNTNTPKEDDLPFAWFIPLIPLLGVTSEKMFQMLG